VRRRLADARRCGIGEEAVEKHCARSEYVCHPKNQLISADIGGVELSTGQPGKQIYLYRTDSGSANGSLITTIGDLYLATSGRAFSWPRTGCHFRGELGLRPRTSTVKKELV
jgi:hypothetical protein